MSGEATNEIYIFFTSRVKYAKIFGNQSWNMSYAGETANITFTAITHIQKKIPGDVSNLHSDGRRNKAYISCARSHIATAKQNNLKDLTT